MNRIDELIRASEKSPADIGRETGLGHVGVHKLRYGKARVNEDNAAKLADALGCTIDELIRPTPPHVREAVRIAETLDADAREEWLALGRRLSS